MGALYRVLVTNPQGVEERGVSVHNAATEYVK